LGYSLREVVDASVRRVIAKPVPVVGRKNHYRSRSLRGTEVAACYTLCETACLVGPEDLLASTLTG